MMSYWSERQKQLYSAMEKDEKALKKRLSSFYDAEYAQLDKQIASYYAKYGVDNVIKYRRLLESLSSDDVKLLMEQMEEFGKKYPQYSHLLPVRESIYKLDRLEGLQLSVRMQQLEIGAVNIEKITEHLNKQALRGLNSSAQAMGFGKNFYSANADIIKQFVNVPWSSGENFSQRIWQNTEKLAVYLNTDIAQGIARGETYEKLTKQLRSRFGNVARRDAYRLIYTEGTYVMAESSMHAFEDDFDEYKISTVGDGKVCDICSGMARNRYRIEDREAGVNFPPFHPWCRCSFEIVVDDWDKWMDEYVAKHGEQNAEKVLNNFADSNIILSRNVNRKDVNIGAFSNLKIPMQKRYVLNICNKYRIDTRGLKIKIQRSEHLLGTSICGSTDYEDIGRIDLMPNAFIDEEQLVKTILHEKCHVEQLKKYGKDYVQKHLFEMEQDAYNKELEYFKLKTKVV